MVIHGTSNSLIARNVAYDNIGHCFYLEDGIEENNIIAYNLAAFVHFMEYPRRSSNQFQDDVTQSPELRQPVDTTASPFYISNAFNTVVGNAASGGWSGFAFPQFPLPLQLSRHADVFPDQRPIKRFDGNSAHSAGYWWDLSGCIYFGGKVTHSADNCDAITYNPGRQNPARSTQSDSGPAWMQLHNTKVFLCRMGIMHWGTRSELLNLEAHDIGKFAQVFGAAYITNASVTCDTGRQLESTGSTWLDRSATNLGEKPVFSWYDTGQQHIVTNSTFRNCPKVWQLLTHSFEHVPEFMQATRAVTYEGISATDELTSFSKGDLDTQSGRMQSWLDVDGTASLRPGCPTLMGSDIAGAWWKLDHACQHRWSMWLCDAYPSRAAGELHITFDEAAQSGVGESVCGNHDLFPCPALGALSHVGWLEDGSNMPLTPNGEVTGPLGGFGWFASFHGGAARKIVLSRIQVTSRSHLMLYFQYPAGTTFKIRSFWDWCSPSDTVNCEMLLRSTSSFAAVADSAGDVYHFDGTHLALRVTQMDGWDRARGFIGSWPSEPPSIAGFTREGITIDSVGSTYKIEIVATCNPQTIVDDRYCRLEVAQKPRAPCQTSAIAFDMCETDSTPQVVQRAAAEYRKDPEFDPNAHDFCTTTTSTTTIATTAVTTTTETDAVPDASQRIILSRVLVTIGTLMYSAVN